MFRCKQFRKTNDVPSRHQFLLEHLLCFNCLWSDHKASNCPIKSLCFKCKKRHSTLLHSTKALSKKEPETGSKANSQIKPVAPKHSVPDKIFTTALVNVKDPFGQDHIARAVLDPDSEISFLSESQFKLFGLESHSEQINDQLVPQIYTNLKLSSRTGQEFLICKAFISKDISRIIPTTSFTPLFGITKRNYSSRS